MIRTVLWLITFLNFLMAFAIFVAIGILCLLTGCAGEYDTRLLRRPHVVGNDTRLRDVLEATPIFLGGNHLCTAAAIGEYRALTARHCIRVTADVTRTLAGVDGPHTVIGVVESPKWDLALVVVDAAFPSWFAVSEAPRLFGETVTAYGYGCDPHNAELTSHLDKVVGLLPDGNLELEGHACHGDSGGPVVRMDGTILGLTVAIGDAPGSTLVVAVPLRDAHGVPTFPPTRVP